MATNEIMEASVAPFTWSDVEAILAAAGGTVGPGKLVGLTLPEFLTLQLYGMPLIAPASSCCGANDGRGARSALIRGLRGLPPFDGSQFLRLPWGGRPVADADIDRIEAWIDEGCPGALVGSIELAGELSVATEARIEVKGIAGTVFNAAPDPAAWRYAKGELRQRMDVDVLDDAQKERLRYAFRELYNLNKWVGDKRSYNNLALIHQNHCQHGWERFLPWHRVYLYEFEQALQDFCPEVTMPWWDFPAPRYRPDDPGNGAILPDAFKAFLTESSVGFLRDHGFPAQVSTLVGQLWANPTQAYDAVTGACGKDYVEGENRKRLIDALLEANSLWYPLRYSGQFGSGTINTVIHYHYPAQEDIDEILGLRTFRDFGGGSLYVDSFGFLDQNPHNTMHIWTGGMNPAFKAEAPADRNTAVRVAGRKFHKRDDLYSEPQFGDMFSNLTASYDPIFWPVHANIDRLWWRWQQEHPDGLPADLDSALTPWNYAVRDTLDMNRFGYEYVRGGCLMPVGLANPVGRFVSAPIAVPDARFRSAEVRLHRVPQLPRSCFIRIFLNTPEADASTPLTVEGYAGYAAIFGHGECYGGPGHCDIPPAESRKFDLRERSMNTPRNHRIDVTRAARRLIAAGATSLTVSLVVIGASYEEDRELLRLDGVSLNFLD
ncbi:tyrosinase family protein [Mesorhizobium sp. L-8-10]|uniref:tyrosinase family protein n=1 Tax=Mesorhizobium sp. L-8-10 TaxID=2744523 RepID=UPI001926692F|nr:tyrosinase family protein [Mesorhizobium sp. L-8-10]